jgi:hypothetical protein
VKSIKLFGLAALAALMAMAFVGASSAMADHTQLCKADESLCAAGNVITHVHEVSIGEGVLLSSAGNVLCLVLFLGDSLGLGNPLIIHGHFTFGSPTHPCVRHKIFGGTENCTIIEVSTDYLLTVLRLGHETADITYSGEVNLHCGSVINCTYNGVGLTGTGKGPLLSTQLNGEITISEKTVANSGGAFCPATSRLDLKTSSLELVYLSE